MKTLVIGTFLFLCFMFAISLHWFSPSFPYEVSQVINFNQTRDPAAIKKSYDFSNLEGGDLNRATKERIMAAATVIEEQTDDGPQVGLQLGHFVVKAPNGEKQFACDRYSTMQLTFYGDGAIQNGELPKMEIEGGCFIGADTNTISPLMIPIAKIMGEPVAETEFQFFTSNANSPTGTNLKSNLNKNSNYTNNNSNNKTNNDVHVRFYNVADSWPRLWSLKSIRMFNKENPSQEVFINSKDMTEFTQMPILIQFK